MNEFLMNYAKNIINRRATLQAWQNRANLRFILVFRDTAVEVDADRIVPK